MAFWSGHNIDPMDCLGCRSTHDRLLLAHVCCLLWSTGPPNRLPAHSWSRSSLHRILSNERHYSVGRRLADDGGGRKTMPELSALVELEKIRWTRRRNFRIWILEQVGDVKRTIVKVALMTLLKIRMQYCCFNTHVWPFRCLIHKDRLFKRLSQVL